MLTKLFSYLEKHPNSFKIGFINTSQLNIQKNYSSLRNYSKKNILSVVTGSQDWNLWSLAKAVLLSEEYSVDNNQEIVFRRLPMIWFFSANGWVYNIDYEIEPGDQRCFWAQLWGYQNIKFIVRDPFLRIDLPIVKNFAEVLSNLDLLDERIIDDRIQIINKDSAEYTLQGITRLLRSWNNDNHFRLESDIALTQNQLTIIEAIADTNHNKIYGNGWKLINLNPINESIKFYNFPRLQS